MQFQLYIHCLHSFESQRVETENFFFFSSSSCKFMTQSKINKTFTKFKLNLYFLTNHLYMQFKLYNHIKHLFKSQSTETENFYLFSKFNEHNSLYNQLSETKFELDLYCLVKYLYMQFQLYIHAYTCRSLQKLEIGNKKFHLF